MNCSTYCNNLLGFYSDRFFISAQKLNILLLNAISNSLTQQDNTSIFTSLVNTRQRLSSVMSHRITGQIKWVHRNYMAHCWGKMVTLLRNNITRFIFLVSSHRRSITTVLRNNMNKIGQKGVLNIRPVVRMFLLIHYRGLCPPHILCFEPVIPSI
jgi:hypothetical protein